MFYYNFIQFLVFIIQPFMLQTVSIEEARAETCKLDTMVTAIQEDIDDDTLAYLFSGQNLWTFNVESFALEGVQRVKDKFPTVEGEIESSVYTLGDNLYVLNTKTHVFEYNPTLLAGNKSTITEFGREMDRIHGIKNQGKWMTCSAAYEIIKKKNHYRLIIVYHDQTALQCEVYMTVGYIKIGGACTSTTDSLPNPGDVNPKELKKEPCEGMMINVQLSENEVRSLLLFATKQELRLWYDADLVHRISMSSLFGCSPFWFYVVMFGFVVFAIVSAIVIAAAVTFFVTRKSRKGQLDETTVVDTTTRVSALTNKKPIH